VGGLQWEGCILCLDPNVCTCLAGLVFCGLSRHPSNSQSHPNQTNDSLRQHVRPYATLSPHQPQLREILLHGNARKLRFGDGSSVDLPDPTCSIGEALHCLRTARDALVRDHAQRDHGNAGAAPANGSGVFSGVVQSLIPPAALAGAVAANHHPYNSSTAAYAKASTLFDEDRRLALPGSLHRISAAVNRGGAVIGLTYRVGRHIPGVAEPLRDLLTHMARVHRGHASGGCFSAPGGGGSSGFQGDGGPRLPLAGGALGGSPSLLLLLGRPRTGKTTLLRDVARLFSSDLNLNVVVVDTSNELGGDGDVGHVCLGSSIRLQVRWRFY